MPNSPRRVASAYIRQIEVTESILQMRQLLGCLSGLYLLHWTTHWQTNGDPFYGDHLLFERLYSAMPEEIDDLAEKMVQMFGKEAVDAGEHFPVATRFLASWMPEPDPVGRALGAERELQRVLHETYDMAKASGSLSLGMDDYLMSVANAHETHLYLLQQKMGGILETMARTASALRTVFLVTDPEEISEFIDITSEVTPITLGQIVVGAGISQWRQENPAIHATEASAKADALERLSKLWRGNIPDWVFRNGQTIQRIASRRRVANPGLKHLDGDGEPDMSAEGHFFDRPRSREMREFAESKAVTNHPDVAKGAIKADELADSSRKVKREVAESPYTPSEVLQKFPGSKDFSTLSRYLVQTEQPTDKGVPQHRDDIPKHPDMVVDRVNKVGRR